MVKRVSAAVVLVAAALPAPALAEGSDSLRVTDGRQLSPRLTELTMSTPAFDFPARVRVLVPAGYDPRAGRRYPVLYLIHGSLDNSASWTDKGHAERATAGLPLIVVMPPAAGKGDAGGWASDWRNGGAGGVPKFETFTIDQLIPWIDGHYRTAARRSGRAVAGLSMGGFSAMSYAVRHPDLFASAASYSGAVDTNNSSVQPVIQGEAVGDGGQPDSIWGPRLLDELYWRAHNPWDLAGNLRGMELALRTGNGTPEGGGFQDPIEAAVHDMTLSLHARLDSLGIAHVLDDYGSGTHMWPYWERDLRRDLPRFMRTFAGRPAPPARVTYTSGEPSFTVFGWHVRMQRAAAELATLADADRFGLTMRGSGTAHVTSAALFAPRSVATVAVGGGPSRRVRVPRDGRLQLDIPLGPANPGQQFRTGSSTRVFSTRVAIAPHCTTRRRFRVRLPRHVRVRSVLIRVTGRRPRRLRGRRRSVVLNLRRFRPGVYRARLTVRGRRGGRSVRRTLRRRFVLCGAGVTG